MRDSPHSARAAHEFNLSLNGYRGLCALFIFIYHLGSAGVLAMPDGSPSVQAATYVWSSFRYGVEMFFMISGFVILGSAQRHASAAGFLKDRFIRIYSAWIPALLAVTIVCAALGMKAFEGVGPWQGVALFVANALLLPPIAPLPMIHLASWSLTYEWVFYLCVAALLAIGTHSAARAWARIGTLAAAAIFICLFPRSFFFVTGVLVYLHRDWLAEHRRWLKFPLASLLIFMLAWRFTDIDKAHLHTTLFEWLSDARGLALLAAFLASLHFFSSITLDTTRETAFLRGRTFQFLGTISYSFYLWHALVMSLTKRIAAAFVTPAWGEVTGFVFFAISSLAIAIVVSWLSWRLFETTLARWMRRAMTPAWTLRGALRAT